MTDGQERVYCPVCQAKFRFIDGWREGDTVMCPICGQRLTLRSEGGAWTGDRVDAMTEKEIRDRAENFAKLRGYRFTDIKEEVIEGLVGKQKRFGDFYCPCRMLHTPEYQCPCKPTRGGDVERNGRCHCGFFWGSDYRSWIAPCGQLSTHVPQPVHFDSSNAGAKVRLSMCMAPVGHVLTTGQKGLLSQTILSNMTCIVIEEPMAHRLDMVLHE